eukprot:TRINITY_DN8_c1_g1_i7.p1 TRINITY_DN8_c1_g1~~TRINITY_DN8_c1_g1_i7.p1  ORF type:complete len:424 (+),score=150.13 TRINITY_DN8_c1_g1_i7:77-1348(+)
MARLAGANDFEKLKSLCLKTHKEQLVWFLNGFWNEYGQRDAENFWKYALKLKELDLQKGLDGNELDELNMHRFLEFFKETMTVSEMRDNLRSTGAIQGNVRMIPISHILIFKYRVDWHHLINASQGDNKAEIEEAQRKLDQVQAAFKQAEAASAEAKRALREAEAREADSKAREANARAKEADAKAREAEARAAQDELQAALNELHAQEAAYKAKVDDLTRRGNDESVGVVTRNKAKAELAQVLAEDPLPLRKAKITQEAAVKKAEKATNAAANARSQASSAADAASQARSQASSAASAATQARSAAEQMLLLKHVLKLLLLLLLNKQLKHVLLLNMLLNKQLKHVLLLNMLVIKQLLLLNMLKLQKKKCIVNLKKLKHILMKLKVVQVQQKEHYGGWNVNYMKLVLIYQNVKEVIVKNKFQL